MKVSIIMSSFNEERFVLSALNSILNQSFTDFEVVIIDDASTDSTVSIIKSFTDPRIKLYENDHNMGLPANLNRAIGLARGDLLARFDADDYAHPDRLLRQVEFLEKNPQVGILGSNAYLIDDHGLVIGQTDLPICHKAISAVLNYRSPFVHPSVMIRKKVIKLLGGYNSSYRRAQDLELWWRAKKSGVIFANLSEHLINYRIRSKYSFEIAKKTLLVGLQHSLRTKSFKAFALSVLDFIKTVFIALNLYTPRSMRTTPLNKKDKND